MRKDRKTESRLVKSVMVYLILDGLTKICASDNEITIVPIAVIFVGVVLTLKIFD